MAFANDLEGNVWGFNTSSTGSVVKVASDGSQTEKPQQQPQGDNGSMVLGADGNLWYTTSASYGLSAHSEYLVQLFGEASDTGPTLTWRAPFISSVGEPVGHSNFEQLLAGPDGRIYAIGDTAPQDPAAVQVPHGPWHLFATQLPDRPVMRAPGVRILRVDKTHGHFSAEIGCTGQSGLFCTGVILIKSGSKQVAVAPYALTPGLTAVHTVTAPTGSPATQIQVTTRGGRTKSFGVSTSSFGG
jgi:hypothetical protein